MRRRLNADDICARLGYQGAALERSFALTLDPHGAAEGQL